MLEQLGINHVDLNTVVSRLGVAEQQIVEIAKAISTDLKVLILNEPNSALTTEETDRLFAVLHQLRSDGVGIIYVSHRLEEVLDLADRITVLRDGRYVETIPAAEASVNQLIASMVGRVVDRSTGAPAHQQCARITLRSSNLSSPPYLNNITFNLHEGEVLGVAGLPNAGKERLVDCCFGLRHYAGEIMIKGRKSTIQSPMPQLRMGWR